MAHESLRVQFWVWHETGPVLRHADPELRRLVRDRPALHGGEPGALAADVDADAVPVRFPLAVYAANIAFAMALSASVGLWMPVVLAVVLGLLPAVARASRDRPRIPLRRLRWAEDG